MGYRQAVGYRKAVGCRQTWWCRQVMGCRQVKGCAGHRAADLLPSCPRLPQFPAAPPVPSVNPRQKPTKNNKNTIILFFCCCFKAACKQHWGEGRTQTQFNLPVQVISATPNKEKHRGGDLRFGSVSPHRFVQPHCKRMVRAHIGGLRLFPTTPCPPPSGCSWIRAGAPSSKLHFISKGCFMVAL